MILILRDQMALRQVQVIWLEVKDIKKDTISLSNTGEPKVELMMQALQLFLKRVALKLIKTLQQKKK